MKKITIALLFFISLLTLLGCQSGLKVVIPREMKVKEEVNLNNVKRGTKLTVIINPIIPKEYIKSVKVNEDDITNIALKNKAFGMTVYENSTVKIDIVKEQFADIEIKDYIKDVKLEEFNFNYKISDKNLVTNQNQIKNNLKTNNPLINKTYNIKGQAEEKTSSHSKTFEGHIEKQTSVNILIQNVFKSKIVFGSSHFHNYLLLDNHEYRKMNSINSFDGFYFDEGNSAHNLRSFSKVLPAGNAFTKSTFSSYKIYENTINDYDFFNENSKTSYNKISNYRTPFGFQEILSYALNNLDSNKFSVYQENDKYIVVEKNNNLFAYSKLNIFLIFDSKFNLHSFYFLGEPKSTSDQIKISRSYKFFAEITKDFETDEEKLKDETLFTNETLYNDNLIKTINSLLYNHEGVFFNRENKNFEYLNIELYKKIKTLKANKRLEIHELHGNLATTEEKNNFKNHNQNLQNSILLSGIGYQQEVTETTKNDIKIIDKTVNSINTKVGINFKNDSKTYIEFDYLKENQIEDYFKNKLELTRLLTNKFVSKNFITKQNNNLNIYTQASSLFLNYYDNEEISGNIKSLYKNILVTYNEYNEIMVNSHLIKVLKKLNDLYKFNTEEYVNLLSKNNEGYFIDYKQGNDLYIFIFDLNFNLTKVIYQFKKSSNSENTSNFAISQFELNVIDNNYTIPAL